MCLPATLNTTCFYCEMLLFFYKKEGSRISIFENLTNSEDNLWYSKAKTIPSVHTKKNISERLRIPRTTD